MDYIEKKIGDDSFTFCVNSRSTRSGFAHDCELFKNGRRIAESTAHYLNRTWERYRFQTVMRHAVQEAIDEAKNDITEAEKYRRGWNRLTAARRAEIAAIIEQNSGVKVLNALREEVENAKYGTESERAGCESLNAFIAVLEFLRDEREARA